MALQCGNTTIAAPILATTVRKMAEEEEFENEFAALKKVVTNLSVGECAGGHRAENRRKSRDIMIQPRKRIN